MGATVQIEHKNLRDKIYDRVKEDILNCRFSPGERLMVDQLAEEMGVSKTPMREALVKLEEEGFVTSVPRGGTYVKKFSIKEIKEIYEIREMLESLAGRLLAASITDEQKKSLIKTCDLFKESLNQKDTKACIQNDLKLHGLILQMCNSDTLRQMLRTTHLQIASIIQIGPNYLDIAPRYFAEHCAILTAIFSHNLQLTEELIRKHIENGKNLLLSEMINKEIS